MGKRHAYYEQMKSMMPYGITGLERVKGMKERGNLGQQTVLSKWSFLWGFFFKAQ